MASLGDLVSRLGSTDEPSEDVSDLISLESTEQRSRQRTALSTWEHSREAKEGEPQRRNGARIFYCKHCDDYKVVSTTSARHHLSSKHEIVVGKKESRVKVSSNRSLGEIYGRLGVERKEIESAVLKDVLDKRVINEALVSLIVLHNLPFRAVEWPEMHVLLKATNPAIDRELISSHSEVAIKINNSWVSSKDAVRKRLQSAISKIHFSADIWTSPNRMLLLGICAHFVDRETQGLQKALVALRPILTHGGADQAVILTDTLQEYGVMKKLGYIIGDNHGSNDKLCRSLSETLIEDGMVWDPVHHRIRCLGHILNLAVQDFIFNEETVEDSDSEDEESTGRQRTEQQPKKRGKEAWRRLGPLGKLHNIIVHIRGSPSRTREFEKLAGRNIPLDNTTRWNSWHRMITVAIEKEGAIDTYIRTYYNNLREDSLTHDGWAEIHSTAKFLHPFHRATLDAEGDDATLDRVHRNMDVLAQHYENALVSWLYIQTYFLY